MSADRSLQRIVVLDDTEAAEQLVSRLISAGAPEVVIAPGWEQISTLLTPGQLCVLLVRASFLPVPDQYDVPVVLLAEDADALPDGIADSIGEQAGASELLRCLRYASERHQLQSALVRAANDGPRPRLQDGLYLQTSRQIELETQLRRALRSNEMELHYQPRVELSSGKIIGVEGLIRWRHPQRGLLGPNEFIPLAEENGLIVPMGYWVIARACHDLRILQRRGIGLNIAVNMSFRQFLDSRLLATVERLIETTGIDARMLEFELTETAIMQRPDQVALAMKGMTGLGVRFSLDDFGTGFSSFVHLHRLPISLLKLDRSFVRGIADRPADRQLVMAMIEMGHNLGLEVVAEGVELRTQMDVLRGLGCDQIQGFFISPALPFDELCYFAEAYGTGRSDILSRPATPVTRE